MREGHLGLVLGDMDYSFSLPIKDTLEIFGMEVNNKLNFSSHISSVCKRINNQFNQIFKPTLFIRSLATIVHGTTSVKRGDVFQPEKRTYQECQELL